MPYQGPPHENGGAHREAPSDAPKKRGSVSGVQAFTSAFLAMLMIAMSLVMLAGAVALAVRVFQWITM